LHPHINEFTHSSIRTLKGAIPPAFAVLSFNALSHVALLRRVQSIIWHNFYIYFNVKVLN